MIDDGPHLKAERDGATLWLTLNRPDRLNAVSMDMYVRLTEALASAGTDRGVRAVVVTGEGRAFCAGADLKAHASSELAARERRRYVRAAQRANRALQRVSKPVVAAVNGPAVGAGLELALSCDFIVVAEDARLRLPELVLGTFVGGGVMRTLPARVGAGRARELLMLGDFFSGSEAAAMGLANRAVPKERVRAEAAALAERLSRSAPLPIAFAKRLLRIAPRMRLRRLMQAEAECLEACMRTRDWREGIDAFAEKRPPRYTGD